MIALVALTSSLANLLLAAFINNKLDEVIKGVSEKTVNQPTTSEEEIV
jgi:hypothetical protein